jgi:hypothetical protein
LIPIGPELAALQQEGVCLRLHLQIESNHLFEHTNPFQSSVEERPVGRRPDAGRIDPGRSSGHTKRRWMTSFDLGQFGEDVMDTASSAYLKEQLKQNIEGFRVRRAGNKRKAFLLRMAVVIFGALTTLLLGLKTNPKVAEFVDGDTLTGFALLCSSTVPIFSAWDAFFDHRWLWVRYAGAQQALYGILDDLEFGGEKLSDEDFAKLYQRFRQVLDETNDSWNQKRLSMEPTDSTGRQTTAKS